MTSQGPTCACCAKPLADGAYACVTCGITKPGEHLRAIADMTPAARDVAHGLSRRGGAGAGGKPGSRLPLDLGATSRLDAVQGSLTTWMRHVAEERGTIFAVAPGADAIQAATVFLLSRLEWMRHRPEVDEFLADIAAAARVVASIARGPSEQRYLGPCGALVVENYERTEHDGIIDESATTRECDGDIYAREGAATGYCRTCGADVSTDLRRAWLDDEVRAHAFRAMEIAQAYGVNVNTIRTWSTRVRSDTGQPALASYWRTEAGLVTPWTDPVLDPALKGKEMEARLGEIADEIRARGGRLHYVGDVLDLAAADAARRAEGQATRARRAAARETAEMGA